MLLGLSFKLWVRHREAHFLNNLPSLFIVIYTVLFHFQQLKFPCGIILVELLNSSYVFLIVKMCIYIENCLYPKFFRHNIKLDIKYYVQKYTVLL